MLETLATDHPNAIALDDLTRRRTWLELVERSRRVAHLLHDDIGLGPDDHAALLMSNRIEAVEIVLGALLAGVWLTPINHHLLGDEIAYVLEDSGGRVLFVDDEHLQLVPGSFSGQILLAGASPEDALEHALERASAEPIPPDGPAGGTMIYTSGTTGRPKGVKRARAASLGDAVEAARAYGASIGLDGHGPHLVTGPLYHAAPLLFAVYDLLSGAPLIVMPRWDEKVFLDLVAKRHVTHTHLVPTMFVRLLRLDEAERETLYPSSLKLVLHGAAPITPEVKRRMIGWWGEVLVEYWGGSESGVATLASTQQWLEHPGTVGRPTPSYEVFAVDESGRRLGAGEIGDLYCRHKHLPQVFEYHNAPEKTAEAYLEPGVFTLGDIGRVDAEGYVYLADRRSHTIISGGVNIYPAEIEAVLCQHPAVADAAVFGIPDVEWGESVKAVIELNGGWQPGDELSGEIIAFCRERLAAYKAPRSIGFEDELPRNPSGKLMVRRLRERYWRGRGRSI